MSFVTSGMSADVVLVVDASVALIWFVQQTDRQRALALQRHPDGLIAPTLILAEVASGLWRHWKQGVISKEHAQHAIAQLPNLIDALIPDDHLVEGALDAAIDLGFSPYDCLYLVLAEQRAARLVTADQSFFNILFSKRRSQNVVLLHHT